MDEKLQRQILRQLRILNFWITSAVVLLLVTLGLLAFLAWQALSFINDTRTRLNQMQQQTREVVDLKSKLCAQQGPLGSLLRQNTDICR